MAPNIFVNNHGMKLWTTSEGAGLPIVLCNGGPGCCDYLAPVAQMLEGVAQVIRFEPRGCGRSDSCLPYTLETCLADLESIPRHYGFERWIVAGHSWGADLALIYALHYSEKVLGFVCLSGGRVHDDREWHAAYSQARDQGLEPLPVFDYPPNLEVNEQVNRSRKQYIKRPGLLWELSQLNRPALFIYGDQDIRPSWPLEQVARLLPNARLEIIAGANHYLWFTHAERMQALLWDFVQKII